MRDYFLEQYEIAREVASRHVPAYLRTLEPARYGTREQEALAEQQLQGQQPLSVADAGKYAVFTAGLIMGVMVGIVAAFLVHGLL